MDAKKQNKAYLEKYFAVLNKFGVTPNFKFSDLEKEIIKDLDELPYVNFLDFCDNYDLKPSEAKEILNNLVEKGAVNYQDDKISLTNEAIKYTHTSKEQRKSEKKFRKFVDALSEKDLDDFMKLVNSFVVAPSDQLVLPKKGVIKLPPKPVTPPAAKTEPKKVVAKKAPAKKTQPKTTKVVSK